MQRQILENLSPNYPWLDYFLYRQTVDSTNDQLKGLARHGAAHGTLMVADQQTGGHGRLGRSFHSPEASGIYMSILLRPNCPPTELMHLTCAVAVAVCDAVEVAVGIRPGIKWTNDLVCGGRKIAGILTELSLSPDGKIAHAVIGIGINCCQQSSDFPPEIRQIAGSLAMVAGHPVNRAKIAAAMMDSLSRMDSLLLSGKTAILEQYRKDCITLGREISVVRGEEVRYGKALDVDAEGALIVQYTDGSISPVNSGEVSVRGLYGYI